MKIRAMFGFLRLLMAAICLVALVARFLWGLGSATFTPDNFFAYLTIRYIPNNLVGVVEKLWSQKGSVPEGQIIALFAELDQMREDQG